MDRVWSVALIIGISIDSAFWQCILFYVVADADAAMVSQGRMDSVTRKNEGIERMVTQTTKCAPRTLTSLEGTANCAECCWLVENIENCCVLEWTQCSFMVMISGCIYIAVYYWDRILTLEEGVPEGS